MNQKRKEFLTDAANAAPDCPMLGLFTEGDSVNVYVHGKSKAIAEMLATMLVSEPVVAAAVLDNLARYYRSTALSLAALEAIDRVLRESKTVN